MIPTNETVIRKNLFTKNETNARNSWLSNQDQLAVIFANPSISRTTIHPQKTVYPIAVSDTFGEKLSWKGETTDKTKAKQSLEEHNYNK